MYSGSRVSLKITAVFVVVGTIWAFSPAHLLNAHEIVKDLFFVLSTAWLLFWLIDHGVEAVRESRASLRESEERLDAILETNPCGIILVDRDTRVTYANIAAANILGMTRGDMIGVTYDDAAWSVTTPDGRPFPEEELPSRKVLKRGETITDLEYAVNRPDGRRLILSVNSAPLLDPAGRVNGMVASFVDVTERRKALELTLRKLSLAIEQSPTAIMITDTDSRIEYVNPSYARMTGHRPEEVLGTKKTTLCEESDDKCREVCVALSRGAGWKEQCRSRRKNGEAYWEAISVSPIRSAEGTITHYLWVREDITEQRLADEALRESQVKFRNLVETVGDLVWETGEEGLYTYVSPKVKEMLGYEPDELVGKKSLFDLMPRFESKRVQAIFAPHLEDRSPFSSVECISRHRDGRYVILEVSGVPFFDPGGTFRGYRGVARDVGERKRAQEALRESEERFRQIFEQNEEPVLIFRAGASSILDANPAAIALYGFPKPDLMRKGLSLFTEPGDYAEFERAVANINPAKGLVIDRATHVRRDGARVIVSVRGKSIRLREGYVSYVTFRDITGRIRMEEEAKLQQAQLIHANRMTSLGTIVSGVAHEVNNPNNLVMFNAPMIASAWHDALPILDDYRHDHGDFALGGIPFSEMKEIIPKLFQGITDASMRIKQIVSNLKDFSRQDKSGLSSTLHVNGVIRTAVAILNHEIVKGTHHFHVALNDTLPPVKGSAQQLEQVLINLIINALQALPDNKHGIWVSTSRDAATGYVEIRVKDEGVGMSPEVLEHLAQPFFTTKHDEGGLGLGLSISMSIVKSHGGTLTFESEVGKGTTARIALPAVVEDSNVVRAEPRLPEPAERRHKGVR